MIILAPTHFEGRSMGLKSADCARGKDAELREPSEEKSGPVQPMKVMSTGTFAAIDTFVQ